VTHQGQDPYSASSGAPPPGSQPGYGQPPPPPGAAQQPPPPGQQPGYQQQGSPLGQPGPGQQPPVVEGLQPPVANLISYLLGWVGGLIMFLTQRNPEVRFHGAQSVGISVVAIAGYIVLLVFGGLNQGIGSLVFALILSLVWLVFALGLLALHIYMAVQSYNQKHVKLPLIGDLAERFSAPTA